MAITALSGATQKQRCPLEQRNLAKIYYYGQAKRKKRYEDPSGRYEKTFIWEHHEGDNWLPGQGPGILPLYNSDLIGSDGPFVVFLEGEKCADRGVQCGLVAVTTGGANTAKNLENHKDLIKNKIVVILPDNDIAGRRYGETIAAIAYDVAAFVVLVELPDLPAGSDLCDWLDAGNTVDDLYKRILHACDDTANHWKPPVVAEQPKSCQPKNNPADLHVVKSFNNAPYIDAAIQGELNALQDAPKGDRNNSLNRAAFKLGQWVASGVLSDADAINLLRSACLMNGLLTDSGPDSFIKTATSGLIAGTKYPRNIPNLENANG